ncbi:hypothetical protein ACH5RR_015206 [Cinchona calisaya]|uniref:Glutaredoxin-like protein n=1 Tax=Cinchona calisaya TaxID=153742 RepID=A0ABD2ZSG6_9GENT
MCHVVKQLLLGLGVNPTILLVDEEEEVDVIGELSKIVRDVDGDEDNNGKVQFPAVFVGGKWFGGTLMLMKALLHFEFISFLRVGTGGDEAGIWAGDLANEVEEEIDLKDIELTTIRSDGARGMDQ